MPKLIDLNGKKFHRWTVVSRAFGVKRSSWNCKCDCGTERTVESAKLRNGLSKSCGCFNLEQLSKRKFVHGDKNDRLYQTWSNMKQRCRDKNHKSYKNYGKKGVSVCAEWMDYAAFREWALNNGYTDFLTIDRIDNCAGYSPDNCRFVSKKAQSRNRQFNRLNELDIPIIRIMYNDGFSVSKIGVLFEVSVSVISHVVNGRSWGDR